MAWITNGGKKLRWEADSKDEMMEMMMDGLENFTQFFNDVTLEVKK